MREAIDNGSVSTLPSRDVAQTCLPLRTTQPVTRFLDGLRGLAALYVLMHHAARLAQNETKLNPGRWAVVLRMLGIAFQHGHVAVVFFFVLSGFVIHLRFARQLRDDPLGARFDWIDFVARRARRLYPPLIAALAITWLCDRVGAHLGLPSYYAAGGAFYTWVPDAMRENHGLRTLLGNLTFLMQLHVPPYGTDLPLWSLAYEWWFYMLYPLLWRVNKRSVLLATLVVVGLFQLTRFPAGWPDIDDGASALRSWQASFIRRVLAALPAWWCGAVLADVYCGRLRIPYRALCLLVLTLPLAAIDRVPETLKILAMAVGFCGILATGFAIQERGIRLRLFERLKFLGDFSYTLYAIHMPLVILLFGLWATRGPAQAPFFGPIGMLIVVCMPIAVAYVVHLFVERPFTTNSRAQTSSRCFTSDLRAAGAR
jgi:peptidoglycan/LPS O-acetylase OafA/YrhL